MQKKLEKFNKSNLIYEVLESIAGIAITLNNIGLSYKREGNREENLEKALIYYNQSIEWCIDADDPKGHATCLSNIGFVFEAKARI